MPDRSATHRSWFASPIHDGREAIVAGYTVSFTGAMELANTETIEIPEILLSSATGNFQCDAHPVG